MPSEFIEMINGQVDKNFKPLIGHGGKRDRAGRKGGSIKPDTLDVLVTFRCSTGFLKRLDDHLVNHKQNRSQFLLEAANNQYNRERDNDR